MILNPGLKSRVAFFEAIARINTDFIGVKVCCKYRLNYSLILDNT